MSRNLLLEVAQKCNNAFEGTLRNMITTKLKSFVVIIFLLACQQVYKSLFILLFSAPFERIFVAK